MSVLFRLKDRLLQLNLESAENITAGLLLNIQKAMIINVT